MSEKLRRIEKDMDDLRLEQKSYVTHEHFDAVLEPIIKTLDTLQRDVKEILRAVSAPRHQKN